MRTFVMTLTSLALFGAILLAAGCAASSSSRENHAWTADAGPIETETATLVVHGMGCPLCANNVDKQLLAVPGVRDVSIDLGDGTVTVSLAEENRPSKAQLAKAVDDSGFTLVSIYTP